MAVLKKPLKLLIRLPNPTAVLEYPVRLLPNARAPTAVLKNPSFELVGWLNANASRPTAVLPEAIATPPLSYDCSRSASLPIAVFPKRAGELLSRAEPPRPVLKPPRSHGLRASGPRIAFPSQPC